MDGFALVYLQRESVKVHFVLYCVVNKMGLLIYVDKVDVIPFCPRQIGVSVKGV